MEWERRGMKWGPRWGRDGGGRDGVGWSWGGGGGGGDEVKEMKGNGVDIY